MSAGTRAKVLMLTTYGLDEYVYAALRAGAAGFMLKTEPPARLCEGGTCGRRQRRTKLAFCAPS
jgi:DNA-binding NarL/FixJ family response regulator